MNCHRNNVGLECVTADCRLWDEDNEQCYDASAALAEIMKAEFCTSLDQRLGALIHYSEVISVALTSIAVTQNGYLDIITPPEPQETPEPENDSDIAWEE
jgi:hypothetical protein